MEWLGRGTAWASAAAVESWEGWARLGETGGAAARDGRHGWERWAARPRQPASGLHQIGREKKREANGEKRTVRREKNERIMSGAKRSRQVKR